jgi:tetratricopeptide (TPR) repeat protein
VVNRVRVNAQLIDGATEALIWAARYDRQLDNIFQVQDEIREAIVRSVAPETMGAESRRSQALKFDDLMVWEQVLRARWHMNKLSRPDNEMADKILAGAIETTPQFAPAQSTRAICLLSNVLHAWTDSIAGTIAAAHDAAKTAVSLDAGDANALSAMGITCLFARKHDSALAYLNRAVSLNPNLAAAYGYLAAVHGSMGNSAAAAAAADKAIRISPLDFAKPVWLAGKGIGAYINERYDEVIGICQDVLREYPNFGSALRQMAAAYAMQGDMTRAAQAMDQLLQRMPGLTVSKVCQIVPVMAPDAQERWLDGLRKAGLPE